MLSALFVASVLAVNPSTETQEAAKDLQTVPAVDQQFQRYASMWATKEDKLDKTYNVFSYTLNAVSNTASIVKPVRVSKTLIRWDLRHYAIDPRTYESVASEDPYFHLITQVLPTAGDKKPQLVRTTGGWIDKTAAEALTKATGSPAAIMRAEWFIEKALSTPGYYILTGIPDTRDAWARRLGADPKVIVDLRANKGTNILYSGVTRKPRRISRWQGPVGGIWNTYDVAKVEARSDPFRDAGFGSSFDGSEHIAAKSNGLHEFAIFDGTGKRVDTVPDRIAKDDIDHRGDMVLTPPISCIRCHHEAGLRDFGFDQRKLLTPPFNQKTIDPVLADKLKAFYLDPKLEKQLVRDREDYDLAVRACADMSAEEVSQAVMVVFGDFAYEQVDLETAMWEFGFEDSQPLVATNDPILLALQKGMKVHRRQLEASWQEAMLLLLSK